MGENEKMGLKIPGMELNYPNSKLGVLSVFILCATIILVLQIILVWAKNIPEITDFAKTVTNSYRILPDGTQKKYPERIQIQFMTPSPASWEFHKKVENYSLLNEQERIKLEEKFKWEIGVDSACIDEFARRVRDEISDGYRYYNYQGEGSLVKDIGLWWVVTMEKGKDLEDFEELYRDFWNPPGGIYVEATITSAEIKSD